MDSAAFDIDNTPPQVTVQSAQLANGKTTVAFDVKDDNSPIQRVECSQDGTHWRAVFPVDGIADSRSEHYQVTFDGELGPRGLSIRASDAMNNVATTQVDRRAPLSPLIDAVLNRSGRFCAIMPEITRSGGRATQRLRSRVCESHLKAATANRRICPAVGGQARSNADSIESVSDATRRFFVGGQCRWLGGAGGGADGRVRDQPHHVHRDRQPGDAGRLESRAGHGIEQIGNDSGFVGAGHEFLLAD